MPTPMTMTRGNDDSDVLAQTQPCPFCGKEVYELAEICPHCHNYIAPDEPGRKPLWFTVAVVLCLVAFLVWFVQWLRVPY